MNSNDIKNNFPFVRYDRNLFNKTKQNKINIKGHTIKHNNKTTHINKSLNNIEKTKDEDIFLLLNKSIDYIKLLEYKIEDYSNNTKEIKQLIETKTQPILDKITNIDTLISNINERINNIEEKTKLLDKIITIYQITNNIEDRLKDYDSKFQQLFNTLDNMVLETETLSNSR